MTTTTETTIAPGSAAELTDAQKNERIARAVGWRKNGNVWGAPDKHQSFFVPDFLHDWAQAGELRDWVNSQGYDYHINQSTIVKDDEFLDGFIVTIRTRDMLSEESDYIGSAETELEAFCNAVIALLDARGDSFAVPVPELARGEGEP